MFGAAGVPGPAGVGGGWGRVWEGDSSVTAGIESGESLLLPTFQLSAATHEHLLQNARVDTVESARTAVYAAMLNGDGGMVAGVADMDVFQCITPDVIARLVLCRVGVTCALTFPWAPRNEDAFVGAGCIVTDANLSVETLAAVAEVGGGTLRAQCSYFAMTVSRIICSWLQSTTSRCFLSRLHWRSVFGRWKRG